MGSLEMSQEEMEKFLAATLGCQVITARRWITGKFTPRKLAIANLRRVWLGMEGGTGVDAEPEGMVDFMGSKIAIHTIAHFFSRLEHAKFCLCAKGWLGYRTGRHPGARDEMMRVLTAHRDIQVHYVFSPDSEAERTILSFLQFLSDKKSSGDSNVIEQVHAWTTFADARSNDGLRYNIASPFILVYSEEGAKELGRSLDVWYELPVAAESLQGTSSNAEVEHILVELPGHDAFALWQAWRGLFVETVKENLKRRSNTELSDSSLRQRFFGLLSLSNEYSGPGSSLEKLSKMLGEA